MVREVFGTEPYPDQIEFLEAYGRGDRRISKRSGHGPGKTTSLAWIIVHHALTRFPQKTVCTAPTSKQLFDALAAETKKWITKLPPAVQALFEVKSERIELIGAPNESFVSFATSRAETPEALQGIHSDFVLLIVDEASGIPAPVFEAAGGSMSGHNATTILAGNPVRSTGLFYDTFHSLRDQWTTFHVSCLNHPNVSPDFVEQQRRQYGERSNAFRVRVLGEFPLADDDTVIPFELVEASLTRDVEPKQTRPIWGVDCARFGDDRSVLAKRQGNVLTEPLREWHKLDTMELSGRIKSEWDTTIPSNRPEAICVDAIGLGAGVADRLRELGLPARAINVAESAALSDRYINLRAELWFKAKDWFTKRDCRLGGVDLDGKPWSADALLSELVGIRFKITSSGKLQVESKADYKKRTTKGSPDLADAFILTLAAEATTALHGASQSTSWQQPLRRNIKGVV